jgi:3-oxoacyl-[acyl-carrier-protein] synthase II
MSAPVITAWETFSPFGHGADAHVEGLRNCGDGAARARETVENFEVREVLGRVGTRAMDRAAGLAVATTARLLTTIGSGVEPTTTYAPDEIGLVLGTSDGIKSVTDFLRDTWTRSKPYDVDPSHVPRTLMNFAAGQCAIWHGIKGPNTTICGGHATALLTLNYARRMQRNGHAKAVLWGAVEEFSAERAAVESARSGGHDGPPPSEGCAMFLLEASDAVTAGRTALAEILGVEFGIYVHPDGIRQALAACLGRALSRAGVTPADVCAVAPSSLGHRGAQERASAADVLGDVSILTRTADSLGDTRAVSGAFQIIELLVEAPGKPGQVTVATTSDAEGRVGCALLRMC